MNADRRDPTASASAGRLSRRRVLRQGGAGLPATLGTDLSRVAAQEATPAASPTAASGDFSGLIDIGGRNLYLECRGQGSPTVILEAGLDATSEMWLSLMPGSRP